MAPNAAPSEKAMMALFRAIARRDTERALGLLRASPALACQPVSHGASRASPSPFFLEPIAHYVYTGDTALHIASAAYRADLAERLVALGAGVGARNRRGAEPLHYAADGAPNAAYRDPRRQAATIAVLIGAGANPNAVNANGVTPLHRAVRTRSAAAVRALLEGGADPRRPNGNGSTAMDLATRTTGKSGSGTPAAREQQRQIIELLASYF